MRWNEAYEKKTQCYIDLLPKRIYTPIKSIEFSGFYTYERLSLEEASSRNKQPLRKGDNWGRKWEYGWFFSEIVIPPECEGKRIVFESANGEALVFVNGRAAGSFDREHTHITLMKKAKAGEKFSIAMEVYAGHGKGIPQDNYIVLIPEADNNSLDEDTMQKTIKNGSFGIMHDEIFKLWRELKISHSMIKWLDKNSLRKAKIEQAIMDMCDAVDLELTMDEFLIDVKKGRDILSGILKNKNSESVPTFYAVGHSHLDLEWLWTREETRRKAARTLGNQLELIREYGDYKYIQSQPWILETVKNEYPDMYEQIKAAVRAGNIIVEGGMWVEADTNIPSGESLIRQFIYGKRFIKNEFAMDSEVLWLPDIFGVSGTIPQIMKGCGVKYFHNAKISWLYNGGDAMPYGVFRWKGIDGTEVLANISMGYTDDVYPDCLIERWRNIEEQADVPVAMLTYGHGDGGGGATRIHLEGMDTLADVEGVPKIVPAGPNEFFRAAEKCRVSKTFTGELYYAAHRGSYTSQAKTKKLNRMTEFALRQAEMLAALKGEDKYNAEIGLMWKDVLFTHFHDVLPGTSISEVYGAAEKKYADILGRTNEISTLIAETFTEKNKDTITVFNPLSWEREVIIMLPDGYTSIHDLDQNNIGTQNINEATYTKVQLPSCGFKSFILGKQTSLKNESKVREYVLENAFLCAEFNNRGELISIIDKENQLEFIQSPSNIFRMYKDMPIFFDAWDIEPYYENLEVSLAEDVAVTCGYSGTLMSCLEISRKINKSEIKQTVVLRTDSRNLEFRTEVDWKETHKLLKVDFNTNIHTDVMLSEIQFGYIKRPTHKNRQADADRFEVCQHKWSALAEGKRGFAILNDCKYGISADEGKMSLTLLKSPEEPARNADKGIQTFTYAIMPYTGSFEDSDVVREAYQLNSSVLMINGLADEKSMISVSEKNVIVEAVKTAEDGSGDVVIRLYECMNSYTNTELVFGFGVKAIYKTDMLENILEEIPVENNCADISFRAFEIVTLKIKR